MIRTAFVVFVVLVSAPAWAGDSECASPSACRPACDKGDASACVWLGEYYTRDPDMLDMGQYPPLGIKLLDGACTKGSAEGCYQLARALNLTAAVALKDADTKRIGDLQAKACKLGYADACDDPKQRQKLREKACAAGQPLACREASIAYGGPPPATGDDPPPPDDEAGGTGTAMALDATKHIAAKPAIKPDPKKAKSLGDRAAKLFAAACAQGKARTCALAGDHKPELAAACKVGASDACHFLARHDLADGKPWVDDANHACDLGDITDCWALSSAYDSGENGVKADAVKATVYRQTGCDAHDGSSCTALAKKEKDAARALALFQRACDESEVFGCEQAADALVDGKGGAAKDPKKGFALYTRACDLEYKDAALYRPICGELAARYEAGNGVGKDAAKAKVLRAQGCERGEKKSCSK